MKYKQFFLLTACVVSMGLLLGVSATQAQTIICENDPEPCAEGESVIRIEDLAVVDRSGSITVYDVDFVFDTAANIYGEGFDFPISGNAALALEAVTDALNANNPTPATAGPQDADQFYIGSADRFGFILSVGGQNINGLWDQCETDCLAGVATLRPNQSYTYADFSPAEDEGGPGKATLISPSGNIDDNTPTYTWNAVAGSTYYFLEVGDSGGNNSYSYYTAEEAGCADGTGECSVTPETELADGDYSWRIQTWNDSALGPWSEPLYFTVDTSGEPPSDELKVRLDENGYVRRIENLPVFIDSENKEVLYNVDFVYATAYTVYGSDLVFDFPISEEAIVALEAVTDALNANDPVPVGAGPQGFDQFFVGSEIENDLVAAGGSELFGSVWDQCENGCVAGVTLLSPAALHTYADFTEVP